MSSRREQVVLFSAALSRYYRALDMATATGLFTKPGAWRWEAPAFLGMTVEEHTEMLNETLTDPTGCRGVITLSERQTSEKASPSH